MKDSKPLSCPRLHNRIPLAVYLCLVLIAGATIATDTVTAGKDDAARIANVTAGGRALALPQGGPNTVGQWGPVQTLVTVPVHISLLPDGRLLYWGRDKAADKWDIGNSCVTYTWNPATGATMTIPNTTTNLFCSGHSFLPDGRLLVAGGHERDDNAPYQEGIGEVDVNVFDYHTNLWTRVGVMSKGRWYPSNVTLANGETVIVSGYYKKDPATLQKGESPFGTNDTPDRFTSAGTIQPYTTSSAIPVYPFLHLATNGKVFVGGPGPDWSKFFDTTANGGGGAFTNVSTLYADHLLGSSVLYDGLTGKVLMMGGQQIATGTILSNSELMDFANPGLYWEPAAYLNFPRKFHNATVLPDGKVLVTGGTGCTGTNDISCGAVQRQPELWDPNIGTYSAMAPNPSGIPRVYHSVAVLLPDARVLVGGGGLPAAGGEVVPKDPGPGTQMCFDGQFSSFNIDCRVFGHKDFEIFSPPYLFTSSGTLAGRPVITSAPDTVNRGQTFAVSKNSGINNLIGSVAFIRLPSVTHGFNFDQRRIPLNFQTISSTSINVTAPADGRVCPPGHYMMFLINTNGVPSVAKIIRVI